jgi:hypothetical protein
MARMICMKTYLLLRNNKQTGPHTLDELLSMVLRSQDLIWIEGQSASWRYPAELDEFKGFVAAPVLEAPLDLGFSQVQNAVVHAHDSMAMSTEALPEEEPVALPTLSVFMRQAGDRPEAPRSRILASPDSFQETPSAVFQTLAGLDESEEEMPTMAWQAPTGVIEKAEASRAVRAQVASMEKPNIPDSPTPALSKIRVTLPAALRDNTTVVIRRKDQLAVVPPPPKPVVRRPVLEFMIDPAEPIAHPGGVSVVVPGTTEIPEIEGIQEKVPKTVHEPKTVLESEAVLESEMVYKPEAAREADTISQPSLDAEKIETPQWQGVTAAPDREEETTLAFVKQAVPAPPESTLQVNIVTIQKVALAAAIVSLIAVAVLIANSIFNPEAYNYENQRQQAIPTEIHSQPQVEKNLPEATAGQQDQGQTADPNKQSSGQARQSANADDSDVVPVVKHDK